MKEKKKKAHSPKVYMSTLGPQASPKHPLWEPYYWFPEKGSPLPLYFTRYSLFQDQTPRARRFPTTWKNRISAFFVTASFKGMGTN